MTCSCGSDLIMRVSGKTSDMGTYSVANMSQEGYVPGDLGIGEGDYINFSVCMNCGTIQNFKPRNLQDIKNAFGFDEEDDDEE